MQQFLAQATFAPHGKLLFHQTALGIHVIGETHVKTMPKGFPKDFPYPEYIRCKDYSCCHYVPEEFFTSPDWLENTAQMFEVMKPFLDFVNATIDEF